MASDDPGPIRRGGRLTARWLDGLRRLVLRAAAIAAEAPLELLAVGGRRHLRLARARPILARLTRVDPATRSYDWAEVQETAPATYAPLADGRSGVRSAFESNLSINLPVGTNGGAVVELRPGYDGEDRRFQWHRRGGDAVPRCGQLPTILLGANYGCCAVVPATFTLTYGGATIGSCVATSSPFSSTGVLCTLQVDLPPGTVIGWSASAPPWPDRAGTTVVPACGSIGSAGTQYSLGDVVTGGVTLTDPDGNAIGLSLAGYETWTGGFTYTRVDSIGNAHGFTVNYEFRPCGLKMTSDFGFVGSGWAMILGSTPLYNTIQWPGSYADGAALPDWTAPTDTAKDCIPLAQVFSTWWDKYVVGGGFGGRPILLKRGASCASTFPAGYNDRYVALYWNPFFQTYYPTLGGSWRPFGCNSTWTVTL